MDSGIDALQRFAQHLRPYLHGILARCQHPFNTSVLEGINNTIKVVKRRAYGYRDQEYLFLKILAAFPSIARWTRRKTAGGSTARVVIISS